MKKVMIKIKHGIKTFYKSQRRLPRLIIVSDKDYKTLYKEFASSPTDGMMSNDNSGFLHLQYIYEGGTIPVLPDSTHPLNTLYV